jgi:drug/metabolite transporter (DMT)-like permease
LIEGILASRRMSHSHTPIPPRALALLAVLTLVGGTNRTRFPLAVREVSVWTFRALALSVAGLTLLGVARLRGLSLRIERQDRPVVLAAALAYLVVWNIASTYAAVMIPSGQAAVLGFTMPLWAALFATVFLRERLSPRMGAALALGAACVGLLLHGGQGAYAQAAPAGFALGLLAAAGWAAGTLILKRRPPRAAAMVLTGWQLLISSIPITLGAVALGQGPWFMPSWTSIVAIAYITLVPMCIGNLAWFSIVGMLPAQVAGLSTIMVPMVAMVTGAAVRGEPLGLLQWAAMACCAGALWLALRPPRVRVG